MGDCDTAGYKQARYDEIANEMKSMLVKVGWKKDFIEKNTPVLPISGWMGDNLLKKSENMGWWKGHGCRVRQREHPLRHAVRRARQALPCARAPNQRPDAFAHLGNLQD